MEDRVRRGTAGEPTMGGWAESEARDVADAARQQVDDIKHDAKHYATEAKEYAQEAVEQTREYVQGARVYVEGAVQQARNKVPEYREGGFEKEERHPRVLVIDDDPSVREVVCYLLASFGYDCQTAADGLEGLARFDEGGWDIVVTDLAMPEMSGWEVAEVIRQRSSTMPIVLITGLIDPGVVRRAGEQGLPVVPKPFRSEMLRAVVAKALQASPSFETSFSPQN